MLLAWAELEAGVATIGGVAPEPALLHRARQPVALLIGVAEQLDGRHLQVLEGEQVGQRAVHRRQVAHDAVDLRPDHALAAVLLRHGQGQQTAVAQQFAFGLGAATSTITLHRAGCQAPGQAFDLGRAAAEVHGEQVRGEQRFVAQAGMQAGLGTHCGLQMMTSRASTEVGNRLAL